MQLSRCLSTKVLLSFFRVISPTTMFRPSRRFSSSSLVIQFKLADIGEGIRDVELKEWYVQVGDDVKQFDKLCEVQSDKANVTITSRYEGTILKLYHNVNDTARVGQPIVDIQLQHPIDVLAGTKTATIMADDAFDNPMSTKGLFPNILATPEVRRMAKELQIPLNVVQGSGVDGRVFIEDLIQYKAEKTTRAKISPTIPPPSPTTVRQPIISRPSSVVKTLSSPNDRTETIKRVRRDISVPQFTYSDQYDITELIHLTKRLMSKVSYMSFVIKACSQTLLDYPILNAHVDSNCETILFKDSHHIGIAMETKDGFTLPNLKHVQQLSLIQISNELHRLEELNRKNQLSAEDLTGGTVSLFNIGVIGGTYTVPTLVSPQVAMGAFGRITRQAVPDGDEYRIRSMMSVSWSADHRIIDGAMIARFSNQLKSRLESPLQILMN